MDEFLGLGYGSGSGNRDRDQGIGSQGRSEYDARQIGLLYFTCVCLPHAKLDTAAQPSLAVP